MNSGLANRKKLFSIVFSAFVAGLMPIAALAHEANSLTYGSFLSGATHPVLGLDHFLAMVCVGIVSAQIGGRAIWMVPAVFLALMAIGSLLGIVGFNVWAVEIGIALSVITLGAIIAVDQRLPYFVAMAGVGLFGIFHGFAHGAEIPSVANPATYAAGFIVGTTTLHILGLIVGDISQHYRLGKIVLRVSGVSIAAVGILFLANAA